MRGHRYVYNRLYRWDPYDDKASCRLTQRPWLARCDCAAGWHSHHQTWRGAWNAAYRHHCPVVITIG